MLEWFRLARSGVWRADLQLYGFFLRVRELVPIKPCCLEEMLQGTHVEKVFLSVRCCFISSYFNVPPWREVRTTWNTLNPHSLGLTGRQYLQVMDWLKLTFSLVTMINKNISTPLIIKSNTHANLSCWIKALRKACHDWLVWKLTSDWLKKEV